MKKFLKYFVLYVPFLGIFIVAFKRDFLNIKDKYGNYNNTLSNPIVFFTSAMSQGVTIFLILYTLLWGK